MFCYCYRPPRSGVLRTLSNPLWLLRSTRGATMDSQLSVDQEFLHLRWLEVRFNIRRPKRREKKREKKGVFPRLKRLTLFPFCHNRMLFAAHDCVSGH